MNKKQIVASLNKIANELDNNGLFSESSAVTKVMSRLAFSPDFDPEKYMENTGNPEEPVFNEQEEYFEVHKKITEALDDALKVMKRDPEFPDDKLGYAEQFIISIKKLSNKLLFDKEWYLN